LSANVLKCEIPRRLASLPLRARAWDNLQTDVASLCKRRKNWARKSAWPSNASLDPDTAEKTPAILKAVAQAHEGMAGVYGAVLVEGMIGKGDPVELLNQIRPFEM
jgi:hypothetical protein